MANTDAFFEVISFGRGGRAVSQLSKQWQNWKQSGINNFDQTKLSMSFWLEDTWQMHPRFEKMRDKEAYETVFGDNNKIGYVIIYLLLPDFLWASTCLLYTSRCV